MLDKITFSKKLVYLRNKCGLSQSKLGTMLNISSQAISKWENALSLPDIELLYPLSEILGVSTDFLLNNSFEYPENNLIKPLNNEALCSYNLKEDNKKIALLLSKYMDRKSLYFLLKLMENETLNFNLNLEMKSLIKEEIEYYREIIPLDKLSEETIEDLLYPLMSLTSKVLNKSHYGLSTMLSIMKCPICEKNLEKLEILEDGENLVCYNHHKIEVIDGIIDFKPIEHKGNNWSNIFRSYNQYFNHKYSDDIALHNCYENYSGDISPHGYHENYSGDITPYDCHEKYDDDITPHECHEKYSLIIKKQIKEITKLKPSVILDIGCGIASFAGELIKNIDWQCTLILNDISHRILKYDKKYFEDNILNPNVQIIYIACDGKKLPFKDNSIDCITSFGGFECMIEDILEGLKECYRVLKPNSKCIYEMNFLDDINSPSSQKWIELLDLNEDQDSLDIKSLIYDKNQWKLINKNIGFFNSSIIKLKDQYPMPNTNKFPYNYEILRWMASGVIISTK